MPRYRESGGKAPGILYLDIVRWRYVPVLYTQWKTFELNIVGKARKICSRWEADSSRLHHSPLLYSVTLHFTIKQFEATSGVTTFFTDCVSRAGKRCLSTHI